MMQYIQSQAGGLLMGFATGLAIANMKVIASKAADVAVAGVIRIPGGADFLKAHSSQLEDAIDAFDAEAKKKIEEQKSA